MQFELPKPDLQRALGRWHRARHAWVGFCRHAQRTAKGLEHGFRLMVGVVAFQVVDVQCNARVVDETLE